MRKITLTNDFHNTEVTLNLRDGKNLSPGQVKKARNTLCGIKGCTCSGAVGTRGWDNPEIEVRQDGSAYLVDAVKCEDEMTNRFNLCRGYAKNWAKDCGSKCTTRTRKKGNGYISHIYDENDDLVGKLEFHADGTTEWSEWQKGSGYIYTEPLNRWY